MTQSVQDMLARFEQLSLHDQHTVAVEILRRVEVDDETLTEDILNGLADERFQALDELE